MIDWDELAAHGIRPLDVLELAKRKAAERSKTVPNSWLKAARPDQLPPPGDWLTWLIQTGRGWGKTRTAWEFIKAEILAGRATRVALIAPTAADARDVMVEGESGVLAKSDDSFRPLYEPSKRRLTWPNGAIATLYSAEDPDQLRGPQHDLAWCDELGAWRRPQQTWDMLMFGLRLGQRPRVVVSTTPRPIKTLKMIAANPATVITRGSLLDNAANLAPSFIETIMASYQGTRLGQQEIDGVFLEDVEGALFFFDWIADARVSAAPQLVRVVLAVDHAVSAKASSDRTGICVAGLDSAGHVYILHSEGIRVSPGEWARRALFLAKQFQASAIIIEDNQGGDLVESVIRQEDRYAPLRRVHATKGKAARAEPVSLWYQRGLVHHVGIHKELEEEMIVFPVASEHDDMVDSMVYAVTEALGRAGQSTQMIVDGQASQRYIEWGMFSSRDQLY